MQTIYFLVAVRRTVLLIIMLINLTLLTKAQQDSSKRYIRVPAGYLMVLRQGDDIFHHLKQIAADEKIPSANISGMGFVNITFGFYDFSKKEYKPGSFNNVELASMHGTIAWQKDTVSLHCHGVVGGKDFRAHAGHILAATVSTGSCEILITTHPQKLERFRDEKLGANVLGL